MSFSEKVTQNVNQTIDQAIDDKRLVGAEVIVFHKGQEIYHEARGYGDREAGKKMEPNKIFRLASVTKPLITAAALKLVEDGKIKLDQSITDFMPYFTPKLPDGSKPTITLHHLLTHTSGLNYGFLETDPESEYVKYEVNDGAVTDDQDLTLEENMQRLAKTTLKFAPGEKFNYSLAIDVVGELIRVVDGAKDVEEVVSKYVTKPLGMNDTSFRVKDKDRLVQPYADAETPGDDPRRMADKGLTVVNLRNVFKIPFLPEVSFGRMDYQSGGGGMHGTAADVAKFLETIRKGGAPILKQETTDLMFKDEAKATVPQLGNGWSFGYGGAYLADPAAAGVQLPKGILVWSGVYGHFWFCDRTSELTVVSLTNTAVEGNSGQYTKDLMMNVYKSFVA